MKVIAFRERGWFGFDQGAVTEWRMWDHLCRAYGAELQLIDDWAEAEVAEYHEVVVVDEKGTLDHRDFDQPNVVYVFGRSGQDLIPLAHDVSVRIETPHPISLFAHEAAAIVLAAMA